MSLEDDSNDPTEEELRTLRKVADSLPIAAWFVAVVELCERFSYYGITGPFQNYIQRARNDPAGPGALGLGQQGATGLTNFFSFWCYVTPIIGAIVADNYLGKYNTILIFALIYMVGLLILFLTALPIAIENGAALGGLIAAMIVIGEISQHSILSIC
jgi:proton-dependent oligopeptide transporter, POT family